MLRIKKFILFVIIVFICLFCFNLNVTYAAETPKVSKDIPMHLYAGSWASPTSWVDEGVRVDLKGASSSGVGTGEAWKHRIQINRGTSTDTQLYSLFSLNTNGVVSIDFSIGMYDEAGNVHSQSQNEGGGALDIYLFAADNDNPLIVLRIWANSGGGANGSHSFCFVDPNNGYNVITSPGYWIKGDASLGDSFYLQFDKENLFSSYVAGSETITRLDDENNTLYNKLHETVKNLDVIRFEIIGSNGFTNETPFILRKINGQSLALADLEEVDIVSDLNNLVSSYYNNGVYIKQTEIFLKQTAVEQAIVTAEFKGKYSELFHAGVTTLERTTYYNGNELWMSRGNGEYSYYGTAEGNTGVTNGTTTEPLVDPEEVKVVLSGEGKNSMNEYYVGLEDIVATDDHAWNYNNGTYETTNAEVISWFKAFVSPCFTGFDALPNFITLTSVAVSTDASGNLVLSLYAASNTGMLTSEGGLFAQAVISK